MEGWGREGFLSLSILGGQKGNWGMGQYLIPVLCVHLLGGNILRYLLLLGRVVGVFSIETL